MLQHIHSESIPNCLYWHPLKGPLTAITGSRCGSAEVMIKNDKYEDPGLTTPGQATLKKLLSVSTWDRCYDFLNIFAEKFGKNIVIFCSNYCYFL
jgi:hypothetical protein